MTIKNLLEGLKILAETEDAEDPCGVHAEHDQIWAGKGRPGEPSQLPHDRAKLGACGFHWDRYIGCWSAYV